MFDFLESDWFIITLEIFFLALIVYDVRKYIQEKKREYIFNIVLTVGFAIWALYPFYTSYFGWEEAQKVELLNHCDEEKKSQLCKCLDEAIFKKYTYKEYIALDKNATGFVEFVKEAKEECNDSGWF
ncbi:MAG: hypothetical protein JXQ67_10385 [Campylobacterales bacterium]|nr:hypothetical protein [Campylobacterales bacterium]